MQAIDELRDAGFSLQAIRKAVENLRAMSGTDRPLAKLTLLAVGNDLVWKSTEDLSGAKVSALQEPGQRLMVFPVGEKHAQLLSRIKDEAEEIERVV